MSGANSQPDARVAVVSAIEAALATHLDSDTRLCVAFSGGLDSSVLLHGLQYISHKRKPRAVHIDHGLHPDSASWSERCQSICEQQGVVCKSLRVSVDLNSGKGLEAAAREARYEAFAAELAPDEALLTAHHQRDQMETVLLQLFRGAGVHGLAAMPVYSDRDIKLLRPLLGVSAAEIQAYAEDSGLDWIEDPSNSELGMDRNYLRHRVLPLLAGRWNSVEKSVQRSARLCADAAEIVDQVADADLESLLKNNRLSLRGLNRLSIARQKNALRMALRRCGLNVPSEKQLLAALAVMTNARPDGQPEFAWPGVRLRRYRDWLWLYNEIMDPGAFGDDGHEYSWRPGQVIDLGPVRGKISATAVTGRGIAMAHCNQDLCVRFRRGGERLRPESGHHTRELKNLLQENDVVPWMRGHIPLIYAGQDLLAVADLWVNHDFAASDTQPGLAITWQDHSAIR